jgi:hypothetical protein
MIKKLTFWLWIIFIFLWIKETYLLVPLLYLCYPQLNDSRYYSNFYNLPQCVFPVV